MLEKIFHLKENGTNIKTEIIAGITTFVTVAYILAVNPSMLADAGMDKGAVFTATALSAAIATLVMGLFANYPIALATGMGLNAYFTYTICGTMGLGENAWKIALTAVLVEGILFVVLSFFKFREKIVNAIPQNLKYGITVGIGLFITIVGMKSAGIIVSNPSTLIGLGDLASPNVSLALIGTLLIGALMIYKVKGGILIGIVATWGMGIIAQLIGWYQVGGANSSLIPDFSSASFLPPSLAPTFCQFDFSYIGENFINFLIVVFAFLYVDLFDTVGTLVGIAAKGDMLDTDGKLPRVGKALLADAVGTVAGSILGTSTVSSYVESSAGVSVGGKTGLTAVVISGMFLLSLFLSPIFLAIPAFATTPALIIVGMLMISTVTKMDFEQDVADTVSGFLAIVAMPFTYSIANGIMFGMLSWVILKLISRKWREIPVIMVVSSAIFILRIVTLILKIA